eukprot:NODE_593_length_2899_cov_5.965007.p1 GENE.NODE_593_length_2899_cov_5.965007~~NODE_593_length_2899_cov_5.965007.p1  ORF type:complete len:838 (-),score=198.74 NODE_593_length_2899_cov_5.965007:223-2736(-)
MDPLKDKILEEAIASGTNLMVPDTASDVKRTLGFVDLILDAGYTLKVAAVHSSEETCKRRGHNRESREGKQYTCTNWSASSMAVLQVQALICDRLDAGKPADASVVVLDNNDGLPASASAGVKVVPLEDLPSHVAAATGGAVATPEGATSCRPSDNASLGWCEGRNLAGCYLPEGSEAAIAVKLDDYESTTPEVLVEPHWPTAAERFRCFFDISSSRLVGATFAEGDAVLARESVLARCAYAGHFDALRRHVVWTDAAPWGACVWYWSKKLPGHSLAFPPAEDAALLEALARPSGGEAIDFTRESFRPFSEAEIASTILHRTVKGASPSSEPKVLMVLGPSGVGKTELARKLAGEFGIDPATAAMIDSERIRGCHSQFAAVTANGARNGAVWYNGWCAVKPAMPTAKASVVESALQARQDVLLPLTGADPQFCLEDHMKAYAAAGYMVHVLCIYGDIRDIMARGIARELGSGKRYTRDAAKHLVSYDKFLPAIAAATGRFKVVENISKAEPVMALEGECFGGKPMPQDLLDGVRLLYQAKSKAQPATSSAATEVAQGSTASAAAAPAQGTVVHRGMESIGGHSAGISFEGDAVWKLLQDGDRGDCELQFLQKAAAHPIFSEFVPAYIGMRVGDDGLRWVGMHNIMSGLVEPALLDLKMGQRTWHGELPPEKLAKREERARATTTHAHGVRVTGCRLRADRSGGPWQRWGKNCGHEVTTLEELTDVLNRFLPPASALHASALAYVERLRAWFRTQARLEFIGSSILLGYEAAAGVDPGNLRFAMIDFAHVFEDGGDEVIEGVPGGSGCRDEGYLVGLETLYFILLERTPAPSTTPGGG